MGLGNLVMPFLSREQIPISVRKIHADAYRDQLRRSLLDPTLTSGQRLAIHKQIDALKGPNVGTTSNL